MKLCLSGEVMDRWWESITQFSITTENSVVSPARTAGNQVVTLDDQLSFAANTAGTTCSCRFIIHNIRKICSFLTQKVVVISNLDYYNSLLAGVPTCALLVRSYSRHLYLPTMAQAHPTLKTWSNHTPQSIHYALLLPNGLLLKQVHKNLSLSLILLLL